MDSFEQISLLCGIIIYGRTLIINDKTMQDEDTSKAADGGASDDSGEKTDGEAK